MSTGIAEVCKLDSWLLQMPPSWESRGQVGCLCPLFSGAAEGLVWGPWGLPDQERVSFLCLFLR